jgi:hypothetical protein
MRTITLLFAGMAALSVACGDNADVNVNWGDLGYTEFPLDSPTGYVSFYMGKQVLDEVAQTGTFIPRPDVSYAMIRVPDSVVSKARSEASQTLSICDAATDTSIFINEVAPVYAADAPDSTNCTPYVTRYDGRMTIEYHSGSEGLYGFVQIGLLSNETLFAGSRLADRIPSSCADDPSHAESTIILGTVSAPDPGVSSDCSPPAEQLD